MGAGVLAGARWFLQGALKQIALTSGGLTATLRSAIEIARQSTKTTVLPSWALWFLQGALKQIALTSGGLTPTFRSVIIRALRTTERNVGDGPTVVGALVLAGAVCFRSRPRQGD